MIVYRAISPSGKSYIGKTTRELRRRIWEHKCAANSGYEYKFAKAIRKYGIENFVFSVLSETNDNDELNALEIYWIRYFDAIKSGYNRQPGGNVGWYSIPADPEAIKKSADKRRGRPNRNKGKKISQDAILKMLDTSGKKWIGVYGKDGHFIDMFRMVKSASEFTGVDPGAIQDVLRGKHKQMKGFIFKRVEPKDKGENINVNIEIFDHYQMKWFEVYKDGVFLFKRKSQKECAKELGLCPSTIHQLLIKRIKYNEKGYDFKWTNSIAV